MPPVVRSAQPSAGRSDLMVNEAESSVDYLGGHCLPSPATVWSGHGDDGERRDDEADFTAHTQRSPGRPECDPGRELECSCSARRLPIPGSHPGDDQLALRRHLEEEPSGTQIGTPLVFALCSLGRTATLAASRSPCPARLRRRAAPRRSSLHLPQMGEVRTTRIPMRNPPSDRPSDGGQLYRNRAQSIHWPRWRPK